MKISKLALVSGLLTALVSGAQAQTFTESFDAADGILGNNVGVIGNFSAVTFTAGGSVDQTKDGVAAMVGNSVMNMMFTLGSAPTMVTVDFWASTGSTATSVPVVTLTGASNGATQTVTGASTVAINISNPGLNGAAVDAGTHYVLTFGAPSAPWAAGAYTLTFNNNPVGNGLRVDDITVTAVPEPQTLALMLAGLAAVGFVAKRRSV